MARDFFLDIETVPHWDRKKYSICTDGRLKDPDKIAENEAKNWKKTSCEPETGTIITIGHSLDGAPASAMWCDPQHRTGDVLRDAVTAESALLEQLEPMILACDRLVTWNGTYFDIPFLVKRAMKHKLYELARSIKMLATSAHVDLKRIWHFNEYGWQRSETGLRVVADFLAIKTNPNDITGKEVADAYLLGDLSSIDRHCKEDVDVLVKIGDIMHRSGMW
jgi:hypothetical protein